jgi:catechol 2,3-dioxygenase-like lactoylglutathione lyase family enzyme
VKFVGICLITNDVPALADFYAEVLGVKAEGDGVHAELNTEGAGIAIFSTEGMESMALGSMQGAGRGSFTGKSQKAPSLAVGGNCKAEDFWAAAPKGFSLRKLPEGETSRKPRRFVPGSFTTMFEVEDVDAEYERLKALNVEFVMLPTTHPWGARSFWFRDPDGNIVDFFANLAE